MTSSWAANQFARQSQGSYFLCALLLLGLGGKSLSPAVAQDFVDHGVGSSAVESRGVATVKDTRGRHFIMAGFATDGRGGAGMGIYDLQTSQAKLLTAEQLIPYHSTVTLQALPGGLLVGGTDVAAPRGGREQATEGLLYLLDFATRKVVFQTVPVPGARYVRYLEVLPDGKVCGLAALGNYFVFDPQTRQVVHTEDWCAHGQEAGLAKVPEGPVYALMAMALFRLDGNGLTPTKLATPPQPAKYISPILGGRLYYAADTNLWSYRLPPD